MSDPIIKLTDVSLALDGAVVLSGITFAVERGESFCITGRAGSGQTLLLKLCAGLVAPTSGTVSRNFRPAGEGRHLMRAGFVFEYGGLISNLSVFDNIALPLRYHTFLSEKEIADKVNAVLARLHITEHRDARPAGLSLGTRKLASIARAIAMRPQIIYYDEPLLGLDAASAQMVEAVMCEILAEGVTFVVVSHNVDFVRRVAGRAVVLGRNTMLDIGALAELSDSKDPDVRLFFEKM